MKDADGNIIQSYLNPLIPREHAWTHEQYDHMNEQQYINETEKPTDYLKQLGAMMQVTYTREDFESNPYWRYKQSLIQGTPQNKKANRGPTFNPSLHHYRNHAWNEEQLKFTD